MKKDSPAIKDAKKQLMRQNLEMRCLDRVGEFTERPDHGGRTFQAVVTGVDYDYDRDEPIHMLIVTYVRDGQRIEGAYVGLKEFRFDKIEE